MNIGPLLVPLFAQNLTLVRRANGERRAGRWFPGAFTATSIRGAVSVPRGDVVQEMPQGRRADGSIRVTTTTELRAAVEGGSGQQSDLILYNGRYHEVVRVKDLQFAGDYQALCARLDHEPDWKTAYFGVGTAGLTPSQIALLGKVLIESRDVAFTVNAGASQKVYFACPVAMGTPLFDEEEYTITTQTIAGVSCFVAESNDLALGAVEERVR
jgi:hypothetical protein